MGRASHGPCGNAPVPVLVREAGRPSGAGFVDPGFRGQLTLCLTNLGSDDLIVRKNDRVVQMILHEVREGNRSYSGRYQDSMGAVEAK